VSPSGVSALAENPHEQPNTRRNNKHHAEQPETRAEPGAEEQEKPDEEQPREFLVVALHQFYLPFYYIETAHGVPRVCSLVWNDVALATLSRRFVYNAFAGFQPLRAVLDLASEYRAGTGAFWCRVGDIGVLVYGQK